MTKKVVTWPMRQANLGRQAAALASGILTMPLPLPSLLRLSGLGRDGDRLLERGRLELADGGFEFGPAIGFGLAAGP